MLDASTFDTSPRAAAPKILPDRRVVPPKPANLLAAEDVAVVILGLDDGGRAHAARFGPVDAELAMKAAELMGMSTLRVTTDEHRAVASTLPAGKVFASGRAFAPFIRRSTFDALTALDGLQRPQAAGEPANDQLPPPKAAKAATGQREARHGGNTGASGPEPADKPVEGRLRPLKLGKAAGGARKARQTAIAAATTDGQAQAGVSPAEPTAPLDLGELVVGTILLAPEEAEVECYYPARLEEDRGEGLLLLSWRDWPAEPKFVRRRAHLALLPPGMREA